MTGEALNRKYLVILAGAALLILVIGALLRPRGPAQPRPVPSPSQTAELQRLAIQGDLRDLSGYFADRIAVAGQRLVYIPSVRATGIPWSRDTLVTTRGSYEAPAAPGSAPPSVPIFGVRDTAFRRLSRPARIPPESLSARNWVVAVARRPDGQVLSSVGLYGGTVTGTCHDFVFRELLFGSPLHPSFAGGALFDLDGRMAGVIIPCGDRVAVASVGDVTRALQLGSSFEGRLRRRYGFRLVPLDSLARRYFGTDSGLLVAEVWTGRAAAMAGLRPGDVLTRLNGAPVEASTDLLDLTRDGSTDPHRITVRRAGALVELTLPAAGRGGEPADDLPAGLGLPTPAAGVPITEVVPGSPAERAGLQAGDRLIRINGLGAPTAAQLRSLLSRTGDRPVYLVYERDARRRGVFLIP